MTQGMIGFWIETEVNRVLAEVNRDRRAATVITRVEVDINDPRMAHPTKPIGPFYTEAEIEKLKTKTLSPSIKKMLEEVIVKWSTSPLPVSILEHQLISTLVENNNIIIACGGGGIPVVKKMIRMKRVEAVIDKDFASERLAQLIDADVLMILTNVENVYLNFNQPDQKQLTQIDVASLKQYARDGNFAEAFNAP